MEVLTDIQQIVSLCIKMTNLKLDGTCGNDRTFAKRWYEEHYLSGKHVRFIMKPNLSINSLADGRVYRAFNTTDERALAFMAENEEYKDYFIDLGSEEVEEDAEEVEEAPEEAPEESPEEEADANGPAPEMTEEEIAALKRSEAAKKAAATRAAKKAAEEAAAATEAAGIEEFEKE